jgi:hypothetical protein
MYFFCSGTKIFSLAYLGYNKPKTWGSYDEKIF